jgi:hypothetical protein
VNLLIARQNSLKVGAANGIFLSVVFWVVVYFVWRVV